jgi:DNA helicase HerA-like ATPase
MNDAFAKQMSDGYALDQPAVVLGRAMLESDVYTDSQIQVALSILNRHGLIAGATGTGKTKTLQVMAGQLSKAGVPCFVADIKGDVTGMAAPGDTTNPVVSQRMQSLNLPFTPSAHPVEFLSLSGKKGAQVRASVHSFGPLLLGKVLGLNDTQTSILSLIFKYCDDNSYPLLDLKDLAETLKYLSSDAGKSALADYGGMSPASVGVLLRSIIVLEQQGADIFFGEPEFDVADLLRTTADGQGIVSLLELSDVMEQPALFSTFMLWMLAQLYETLPEVGDLPKPKLCFFFDEAHLLFDGATDALLQEIERTARLIRSKGVGVYLVTQAPTDVPSSVLSQLGNRVQHALRAFTPEDADNLKKTARTFPMTDFYDVEKLLTSLGIGEAAVTVLSPKGVPTPLAATRLVAPDSSMSPIPDDQFASLVAASPLQAKYGTTVDRESAYEIIKGRIDAAAAAAAAAQPAAQAQPGTLVVPAAPPGQVTMTPAEVRRMQQDVARQAKEQLKEQQRQEREDAAAQKRLKAEQVRAERERQRTINSTIRAGEHMATSRLGQDVIRGVFGTLFGGGRK